MKIEKLNYLLQSLQGPAREILADLQVTDDNYDITIDLLQRELGNQAISVRVEVQIGSALSRCVAISEEEKHGILADEEIERHAAAAAKQAKLDAEREKLRELKKLREKQAS
ncbi:unnamed protein product [Heligmosomoides polygyrus]|uniref:Phage protein n=1 Tax=Heligmosomoides polygyrus TaxID=6339 RepID=A0A183GU51_HELPZ|nr:unnamed protein product [Heligmosomoides polygyrus]